MPTYIHMTAHGRICTLFSQLHYHTYLQGRHFKPARARLTACELWYVQYNTNFFSLWDQYIIILLPLPVLSAVSE